MILDEGADLDLIINDVLPRGCAHVLQKLRKFLRSAGDYTLIVDCLKLSWVDRERDLLPVLYRVASMLVTKVFLCEPFIDKHSRCVPSDLNQVTPEKGSNMSILASVSEENIATINSMYKMRAVKSVCRVQRMSTILPYFKAPVLVITNAVIIYVPESSHTNCAKTTMFITKSIDELLHKRSV